MRALNRSIWPHRVIIGSDNKYEVKPIEEWLLGEVGQIHQTWYAVYRLDETHFYFRQSDHATYFALKWS